MKPLETKEARRERWGLIPEDGPRENRSPRVEPDNELGKLIRRRLDEMLHDDPHYKEGDAILEVMERWELEWSRIDERGGEWLALAGRPDQAERDEWERIEENEREWKEMRL